MHHKNRFSWIIILVPIIILIGGCAVKDFQLKPTRAKLGYHSAIHDELISLPVPKEQIVVAVYKFRDQSGQYKSSSAGMTWSTAVSQGITSIILKSLEDSGWFITLEREGLSNLLNERRIIRQTREQYQSNDGSAMPPLPPLLYAGVTLEGGIISYETNTVTGGFGAKYFGLGGSTQFRRDEVTVYIRAISTKNGRILKTVYTTKSILSRMVDVGLYRYVRVKRLLEVESGFSTNEPINMCVTEAIDKAVYSLIVEGILENLWELKNPQDIKSPLIQQYLDEKRENEKYVQFDKEGNIIQEEDLFTASNIVKNRTGIGFNLATTYYVGDYPNPRFKLAGDFKIRRGVTSWLSFNLGLGFGQIADKKNFKTIFTDVNFTTMIIPFTNVRLSPYIFFGAGGLKIWVNDDEGDNVSIDNSRYQGWKPNIVSGFGWEYFVNRKWGVNFQINNHFTFNDELDGMIHGKRDDVIWGGKLGLIYYFGF